MGRPALHALAAVAVLAFSGPAFAQPAPVPSSTANLQGDEGPSWMNDPHMHAFYALSVKSLGKGAPRADVAAYEQRSYEIFRAFAASRGMDASAMQDHLKAIPRQIVQIVKEDPKVLDSYAAFTEAMIGPP